jgi:hypothetical protein
VAVIIKERGGIEKLASEAAARARDEDTGDADDPESDDNDEAGTKTEDPAQTVAASGADNTGPSASNAVAFKLSSPLAKQINELRGARIKLIGRVPEEGASVEVEILKVVKLKPKAA